MVNVLCSRPISVVCDTLYEKKMDICAITYIFCVWRMAYNTAALCYAENAIFGQRCVGAIHMHICMLAEEIITFFYHLLIARFEILSKQKQRK